MLFIQDIDGVAFQDVEGIQTSGDEDTYCVRGKEEYVTSGNSKLPIEILLLLPSTALIIANTVQRRMWSITMKRALLIITAWKI